MPKIKTKKSAAKRFTVTKSGRIKRAKAFRNHILTKKSTKRKRQLRKGGFVSGVEEKNMKQLIPYK